MYQFTPGEPPSEIQLWNRGENPTDLGVHIWSDRSVVEVFARYEARGNLLQIDVEHNNADPPKNANDVGPSGGYASLEIRGGLPWLVFQWSAFAIDQIRTRQRLYLSPEYDTDKATGEITRLIRVSLVGDPATHNARQLASAKRHRASSNGGQMDLALILAALKAAMSAEDPAVAKEQIANLVGQIETLSGGSSSDSGASPAPTEAAAPAAEQKAEGAADGKPSAAPATAPAEEKKDDPIKASATRVDPEQLTMATRLATLEARELDRAADERIRAAGARIPESLRAFAKRLNKEDFDVFVKGLPEAKAVGIRASASATKGEAKTKPEDSLDAETKRHLARAFGAEDRPAESVVVREDGRLVASHIYKRKA